MDRVRWTYVVDDIRVDPHAHRVTRAGSDVALEPKAFSLLLVLLDRPGELLNRDELLDLVWKHRHVAPATLSRIIAILRRALGDDIDTPRYIETVHGLGYRFVGQVEHVPDVAAPIADSAAGKADESARDAPLPAAAAAAARDAGTARRVRRAAPALLAALAGAAVLAAVWPRPQAIVPADKSIAVLPFQNLSADKDNGYLVDGVRDEILTRLAGIRDLKVISRTSADRYPSRPDNVRTVAAQLGVATILEGCVQQQGGSAHINIQLIDAGTDAHLWAESYDRDLADMFAVEREVAQQVAAALKAQLLPEETMRVASEPTKSPDAYHHYLRSLEHFDTEDVQKTTALPLEQGRRELQTAIAELEKALASDAEFALARALLAQARMVLYWNYEVRSEELLAGVRNAAEEALAQQPSLGEAHLALALYHFYGYRAYALALKEIEQARRALPNSAKVEKYAGLILRRQGQWDLALASFEKAAALDPRRLDAHEELATTYWWVKRYAEAAREFETVRQIGGQEGTPNLMDGVLRTDLAGDVSLWRPALARVVPQSDDYDEYLQALYTYAWFTRDFAAAIRLAGTPGKAIWFFGNDVHVPREIWLAWAQAQAGDAAAARPLYEKAHRDALAALERNPDSAEAHLVLGFASAGLGLKEEAIREGVESTELTPVSRDAVDGPDFVAGLSLIYLSVGEYDRALELLQKLVTMPAAHVASPGFLKLNAHWDPVRGDPRFAQAIAAGEAAIRSRPPGY